MPLGDHARMLRPCLSGASEPKGYKLLLRCLLPLLHAHNWLLRIVLGMLQP